MSREIRFRAWNIVTKTMIDLKKITPLALNMDTDGLFLPFSDGLPLMQFTGLTDKNGKEIYEGDIVSSYNECSPIEFRGGSFGAMDKEKNFITYSTSWNVIGNIYENPEMLSENLQVKSE